MLTTFGRTARKKLEATKCCNLIVDNIGIILFTLDFFGFVIIFCVSLFVFLFVNFYKYTFNLPYGLGKLISAHAS